VPPIIAGAIKASTTSHSRLLNFMVRFLSLRCGQLRVNAGCRNRILCFRLDYLGSCRVERCADDRSLAGTSFGALCNFGKNRRGAGLACCGGL
jgi:hypothetical protein